jgi:hypothetical protein
MLALGAAPAQDPNHPGILDPILEHYRGAGVRLPGSDQVLPPSELVNILGGTRRRPAVGAASAAGSTIGAQGLESPNRDLRTALDELDAAALAGNSAQMRAWASEAVAILDGATQGRIYDGFPMLAQDRGAWRADHVPGEYLTKRVQDSGRRVAGPRGRQQVLWTVEINVLIYDDEMDCDTAFLLFPPTAHPLDRLVVQWKIYSSEGDNFIPTTMLEDFSPFGEGKLPSKSYDATWVVVDAGDLTEVAVNQGAIGGLRGLQAWRWRTPRPCAIFVQPVFEHVSPASGLTVRDARGAAAMALRRGVGAAAVGAAAPEAKIRMVADAVAGGVPAATIRQMMNDPQTPPLGTWRQWTDGLEDKDALPMEAWLALAQEGITPGMADPFGPYDAVIAWANHELYVVADDAVVRDPLTGRPVPQPADAQGARIAVKVFNFDAVEHYLSVEDYGPPLHDDVGTCSNAPGGSHSLEIFNQKPIYGAPKIHELQWRAAFGVRRGAGHLEPYDLFPRVEDLGLLQSFTTPAGATRSGWAWPADLRGADFVVQPAAGWLGAAGGYAEPGVAGGLRIGATTPGFGLAKMPAGDLKAFHPDGYVNLDTNGDLVPDALVFPAWMRNPDPQGGDLIPTSPDFEPFLWLSPENGTPWVDPQNPAAGPWAARTYAFGQPVAAGSAATVTLVRPRFTGQGLWYSDGLWRDGGVGVTHHHENEL